MTNKKDWLPKAESGFFDWQHNFDEKLEPNLAKWGIPVEETNNLTKARDTYLPAYDVANKGKINTRTKQQIQDKNDATIAYQKEIRRFTKQWLSFNNKISNGERLALGIPIPDTVRTDSGVPASVPDMFITPLNGNSVKVTVRQQPDADGRSGRGKPADAAAFQLAIFVGENPPAAEACIDKREFTKSPVQLTFQPADANKTVTVYARWIGFAQQKGKWCQASQEVVPK